MRCLKKTKEYDFGGYVTKNDLKCSDGRIIRHNAFKDCDGKRVPLVYQHVHTDPTNIIGHADLENRPDGVYGYCSFNNTESGRHMKESVQHGDLNSLSIYANRLKQQGADVLHGVIREVSVVLAGANPGAFIENVSFSHSDGYSYESDEDIILSNVSQIELAHSDDEEIKEQEEDDDEEIEHADNESSEGQNGSTDDKNVAEVLESMNDQQRALVDYFMTVAMEGGVEEIKETTTEEVEHADDDGPTVQDVWDSMTEEQQTVTDYLVGKAMEDDDEEIEIDEEEEILEQSDNEGSDMLMYNNVFANNAEQKTAISLTHDDMTTIIEKAKAGMCGGSLKEVAKDYIEHTFELEADDDPMMALQHGIEALDILFPEAKAVTPTPELVSREMGWVSDVWNATHKSPFSRIKSTSADITADEARARGYIKGKKKIEEVVKLAKRITTPQTVYKLQKLDRDDVIDATELDVVAWLKTEMRMMLNEELSRAILIGDGREDTDESKIKEENIRPIYQDDDFYTIHYDVQIPRKGDRLEDSDSIVDAAIISRTDYMGSGSPVMYAPIETINTMLLARDKVGHRLYANESDLASALRVSKIVEVPVMTNCTRTDEDDNVHKLIGLIVNLRDYTVGADKGGAVTMFDDFDINYNKYEYLIETRCSGALTKPYSAIALEELVTDDEEDEGGNDDNNTPGGGDQEIQG